MDLLRKSLVGVTVVGLAIDAYVHLKLASGYDMVTASISQGALFRIESAMAIVAAVLLLVRPGRLTAGIAAVVAGGGVVALLLYYFVNVGQIGPIPNMYEHAWYADKVFTLVAQAVATGTALALVFLGWPREAAQGSIESRTVARQIVIVSGIPPADEQLVRELYDQYAPVLLGYVSRLVGGDRQRAEDIVQETLASSVASSRGAARRRPLPAGVAVQRRSQPGHRLVPCAIRATPRSTRRSTGRFRQYRRRRRLDAQSFRNTRSTRLAQPGASRCDRAGVLRRPLDVGGGRTPRSTRGHGQVPLPLRHARTSGVVPGEGAGFVNCREVQEEIATAMLTDADLDEVTRGTSQPVRSALPSRRRFVRFCRSWER